MLKKTIYFLSILGLVNFSAAAATTEAQKRNAIIEADQIDNSDIFAIPLDDSAEEDEEEMAELKAREQKFIEKKAAQKAAEKAADKK
jgi:hypothetical protein